MDQIQLLVVQMCKSKKEMANLKWMVAVDFMETETSHSGKKKQVQIQHNSNRSYSSSCMFVF